MSPSPSISSRMAPTPSVAQALIIEEATHPAPSACLEAGVDTPRPNHLAGAHSEPSPLLATREAQEALRLLAHHNLPAPTLAHIEAVQQNLHGESAYAHLANDGAQALVGKGAPPDAAAWANALITRPKNATAQARTAPAIARNMVALVFMVMLDAQRSAMAEKREALRAVKMFSGMLEDLNLWVARVVVPAQRALNVRTKEAQDKAATAAKKSSWRAKDREERLEETVVVPIDVDTQWGVVDEATGKISLRGLDDASAQKMRVDQLELSALVSRSDQWRATLQNNQSRQATEFQRIDNAMSSTWNMLSAFVEAAQEGASSVIRNGLG